jgi:hypothetical protein
MIPRIQTGTSFRGAGLYYLHDKKQDGERERLTTDRVAWTHSLNTLEDEPQAVLDEMRQTALDQGMLKQLAGNRGDGRPTGRTVMTVALAWSPDQSPDRAQMIEAGISFLDHMGWQEHQVLFVAHNDTAHPHVHLIINRVHPESGMTLDDNWSKRRSQQWALAYEREHGHIYCDAREAKYGQSRESMNYRDWQELNKDKAVHPEYRQSIEAGEWTLLKQSQRQERTAFWDETGRMRKELRAKLREEVREEFAEDWQEYAVLRGERTEKLDERHRETRRKIAKLRRDGASKKVIEKLKEQLTREKQRVRSELADARADISGRQKQRLDALAVPALDQLTKDRLEQYQLLLAQHRSDKAELRGDQQQDTRRYDLLGKQPVQQPAALSKLQTQNNVPRGNERTRAPSRSPSERETEQRQDSIGSPVQHDPTQKSPRRGPTDLLVGAGLGAIGKLADALESLLDGGEPQNEKGQVMAKDDNVPQQPKNPPPTQDQQEQEARRKQDLEFYLQQRDRERHHDRGR